jgi:predicted  nucleic acid-binding Zn-ribbon protein
MEVNDILNQVEELEKTQSNAQLQLSKFEGQLLQEMKRLETDFGLHDLEQVKTEITRLEQRVGKIDKQIVSKFEELKESYDVAAPFDVNTG